MPDVKPLLAAFLLTAVATTAAQLLPPGRELHALALLLDFLPWGGVVAATAITTLRLRRASASFIPLLGGVYGYFAGALVGALGVAHSVAVLIQSIARARHDQSVYNFHVYSLFLLGTLLIAGGLMAALQTEGLTRGNFASWRAAVAIWTAILAINLPLAPLQGFAILFSILAALNLCFLCGMRRRVDVKSTRNR